MQSLRVTIDAWKNGETIPDEHAMGIPAQKGHATFGRNLSPGIRWSGAPGGTRSFAIICRDPDAPSKPDKVNKEGMTVPADLPRVDFYHWVLVDIPAGVTGLDRGADSEGVTKRGKPMGRTEHGVRGINDYTGWFAGDEAMEGDYGGYDGPFPPWNDERVHHYHFTVYAIDAPTLGLTGRFRAPEAIAAMKGRVLAHGEWVGTYTLNGKLRSR